MDPSLTRQMSLDPNRTRDGLKVSTNFELKVE